MKEEYSNLKPINKVLAADNNHKGEKIRQLSIGYHKNFGHLY